jgi:hypothetical protein
MITEPQEFVDQLALSLKFESISDILKCATQFCIAQLGYIPRFTIREIGTDNWPPDQVVSLELINENSVVIKYMNCVASVTLDEQQT